MPGLRLHAVNAPAALPHHPQDEVTRRHLDMPGTPVVGVRKDSGSPGTPWQKSRATSMSCVNTLTKPETITHHTARLRGVWRHRVHHGSGEAGEYPATPARRAEHRLHQLPLVIGDLVGPTWRRGADGRHPAATTLRQRPPHVTSACGRNATPVGGRSYRIRGVVGAVVGASGTGDAVGEVGLAAVDQRCWWACRPVVRSHPSARHRSRTRRVRPAGRV